MSNAKDWSGLVGVKFCLPRAQTLSDKIGRMPRARFPWIQIITYPNSVPASTLRWIRVSSLKDESYTYLGRSSKDGYQSFCIAQACCVFLAKVTVSKYLRSTDTARRQRFGQPYTCYGNRLVTMTMVPGSRRMETNYGPV